MYSHKLQWKKFPVSILDVEVWIKANCGANYVGNSAAEDLTLWYTVEPTQEMKDALEVYWASLSAESSEAANYVSVQALRAACDALKAGLASKSWDSMSIAERKLVLGQMPTKAELGL